MISGKLYNARNVGLRLGKTSTSLVKSKWALLNEKRKNYHTVGFVLKFQLKEKRKQRKTSIPLAHPFFDRFTVHI
jgi:hypothetical protein